MRRNRRQRTVADGGRAAPRRLVAVEPGVRDLEGRIVTAVDRSATLVGAVVAEFAVEDDRVRRERPHGAAAGRGPVADEVHPGQDNGAVADQDCSAAPLDATRAVGVAAPDSEVGDRRGAGEVDRAQHATLVCAIDHDLRGVFPEALDRQAGLECDTDLQVGAWPHEDAITALAGVDGSADGRVLVRDIAVRRLRRGCREGEDAQGGNERSQAGQSHTFRASVPER